MDDIDEQRLLAYKEGEKSWSWIFRPQYEHAGIYKISARHLLGRDTCLARLQAKRSRRKDRLLHRHHLVQPREKPRGQHQEKIDANKPSNFSTIMAVLAKILQNLSDGQPAISPRRLQLPTI
jgi:hypothetical protein